MERRFVADYQGDEEAVDRATMAAHVRQIAGQVDLPDAPDRMIICYYSEPDASREMRFGLRSLMTAIFALIKGNLSEGRRYRRMGVIVVLDDGECETPGIPVERMHA